MNFEREWHRSEFQKHEVLEAHCAFEPEFAFYDAVASGDVSYIENHCNNYDFSKLSGLGKLSETPLQNLRYHFVITTAMITRSCIHSGMEHEKAYTLSDFYIHKMDSCQTIEDISTLHDVMCIDFCQKMLKIKKHQLLSKPIVLALDYIYNHIHYRVTISEIAEHLNLSESYLSKLFHKEMGIPISQYILDKKIDKAKNLLQYSEYTIVEIANYLAFSSQSHFIQVFQKKTGMTPHKYRTSNFRSNWEKMSFKTNPME